MTSQHTCKTVQRWHNFSGKVSLLPKNSKNENIGCVVDEQCNVFVVESQDSNDRIIAMQIRGPE